MKLGRLGSGGLRASNAERADAVRRLGAYEKLGHLEPWEAADLTKRVSAAKTRNEVAQAFTGLPPLPANSPADARFVANQDREDAIGRLDEAKEEGRLEEEEHSFAVARVAGARTRDEIDAAFHGLPSGTRAEVTRKVSSTSVKASDVTSKGVREGGRRFRSAFRRGAFGFGLLLVGLILLVAGISVAAVVCFVAAVAFFVAAAIALVRWWG